MKNVPQDYPRISEEKSRYRGYLDDSKLNEHIRTITKKELKSIVKAAILNANKKSGRKILDIPDGASQEEIEKIYIKKGKELFQYFQKYCGDPASSAFGCLKRNFRTIAKEQFRNWTLQKERMNSGWRYQYIAKDSANHSGRFISVSDIGTAEADFNAILGIKNSDKTISIYVSVKNRVNTMGGQDWPKAIHALEDVARTDKNRTGPYICIFGIAMDKGTRIIKVQSKTRNPFSVNTELWKSDFFWPFFTNLDYDAIIKAVLDVLLELGEETISDTQVMPVALLESFGSECRKRGLLNEAGNFNDAYKLVDLFCGKLK